MLRLRGHLLPAVRAASPLQAASFFPIHRLFLYSTTNTTPASQFVVEDYLTTSCGLKPEQARRASRYLPGLESPDNADAVRAFLAGIGVSKAEVATAISRDPRVLRSKVDIALTPCIAQLRRDVGLSPSQISRLISVSPTILIFPRLIPRLAFYLSFLGSYDNLHTALRRNMYLLTQNLERVVKPNMAFLRQSGLTDSDIAKLLLHSPRLLAMETGRFKETVVCADMLGVPRSSAMFKYAILTICHSPGNINARSDFLKKALGCSEAELGIAIRKLPKVLNFSDGRLSRVVDFLKTEVGLDSNYIVHRPAVLCYSLPRRLMPRHYVLKTLKAKGLVEKDADFFSAVHPKEEVFTKRFLDPYKDSFPGLADAYAAACAGQVPVIQP